MAEKIEWIKTDGSALKTNSRQATIDYCVSLGWTRKDEQSELPAVDPDKGSGIPGSVEWLISAILGMENKAELVQYLKEADIECNTKGQLDSVKKKAIDSLRVEDDNSTTDSRRSS